MENFKLFLEGQAVWAPAVILVVRVASALLLPSVPLSKYLLRSHPRQSARCWGYQMSKTWCFCPKGAHVPVESPMGPLSPELTCQTLSDTLYTLSLVLRTVLLFTQPICTVCQLCALFCVLGMKGTRSAVEC